MKIGLFSFDGPMYKDCNGIYCNTTITDQMLERYFEVVDKLIVVIRTHNLNESYTEAGLHKVEMKNCEVLELPNFSSIKGYFLDRALYSKVIDAQVERADLIFARIPSVTSDIVIKSAIKKNKRYLVEVGGCAWDAYWNHGYLGKIIAPIMYFRERSSVKYASHATYVTDQWLQNRYPTNGSSAVASNVYLPEHVEEVIERRIDSIKKISKKSKIVIGTAAAVDVRYKGQESIIKAMSIMVRKGYNLHYEMIGVGDFKYLSSVAKKYDVEDRVVHKGILVKKDVFKWLDNIDIYAQPSKQEGLPRALIEAMSRGLPSIGSNVAGIPELLSEEVVFTKGDVPGICNVLDTLIGGDLERYANLNYIKSKKFNLLSLQKVRSEFFFKYLKSLR
jgi:glycosyltransferase involved in cell wall biosynthesis